METTKWTTTDATTYVKRAMRPSIRNLMNAIENVPTNTGSGELSDYFLNIDKLNAEVESQLEKVSVYIDKFDKHVEALSWEERNTSGQNKVYAWQFAIGKIERYIQEYSGRVMHLHLAAGTRGNYELMLEALTPCLDGIVAWLFDFMCKKSNYNLTRSSRIQTLKKL